MLAPCRIYVNIGSPVGGTKRSFCNNSINNNNNKPAFHLGMSMKGYQYFYRVGKQ